MRMGVKLLMFGLLALVTANTSDILSEPPPLTISHKFSEGYGLIENKMLTQDEFENLKEKEREYLDELTNKKNTSTAVNYIAARKIIIVPLIALLWVLLGLKAGFQERKHIGIAALTIFVFSMQSINMFESILYAIFFIVGNFLLLRKTKKNIGKQRGQTH